MLDPNEELDRALAEDATEGKPLQFPEKVGDLMEEYRAALDTKDAIHEAELANNAILEELQYKLIQRMDEQELDKVSNDFITLTKTTGVSPTVKDKDALFDFVFETGERNMLIIRVNDKSFKEWLDRTGEYPEGVEGYVKTKLAHRRNKKK